MRSQTNLHLLVIPVASAVDCCRKREDAALLFSSTSSSSCRLSAGVAALLPTTHHPPQIEIKKGKKKKSERGTSSSIGEAPISDAEETQLKGGAEIDAHIQFVEKKEKKKTPCGICCMITVQEKQIQTGELYLYWMK